MERQTFGSGLASTIDARPSPQAERRSWWRLLAVLAAATLSLLLVTVLARRVEVPPPRAMFDSRPLRRMQTRKPHFVLLGNSMVYTRFHEKTLNRALAPKRVMQIAYPGGASAIWYLALKNYVAGGKHRPKRVLLFFRHSELTMPSIRTTGKYARTVAKLSSGTEEVLARRLTPGTGDAIGRVGYALKRLSPVERLRPALNAVVQGWARIVSARFASEPNDELRERSVNDVFALSRLRSSAEPQSVEPEEVDFESVVQSSFLPDMLELAHEQHFALTFIRIRSRASADGQPEAANLLEYLAKLERYVRARGADYVDMKDASWETAQMYRDGDHLSPAYSRTYTKLFAEHMASLFR